MKKSIGFPYLLVSLSFALSVCSSLVRSRALLDDAVGAPSPLAGDSIEYRMSATAGERPQQNIALILMAGVSICFAVFMLSCCIAYRTIVVRQGEMNRRHRSRVRGMTFDEQDIHGAGEEEGIGSSNAGGLDASLVRSLPTVQYKSGMLKEEEMKAAPLREVQNVMWVKECAVCLSEYGEGEEMKVLPVCGHCFHKDCIGMWLSSHSTCPICRLSLRKHAEAMPAADPAIGELSPNSPGPPRGLQLPVDI